MALPRLYDTLTRTTSELVLREPGRVYIYSCGPTVYDVPHAGHARTALVPDVLVRHLRSKGVEVTYARNITDVDDKILERAKLNDEPPLELSKRMAQIYQETMRKLGCLDPDHEPRVSDHLPQIFQLLETLILRGSAYAVELPSGKRDVYFSVRSFEGYGKLSRRKIDELVVGARVEPGEVKRDPLDFALWKGAAPDEWGWDGPWGRGRPGWHIECSAMSTQYLRHGFDVHTGGMDLIFPHHENEIAQSEAAAPDAGPFARLWLHNGFVNVDKEKMSKSLGNFVTVSDVLERNDAEALRWFLLTFHYRGPIQFDFEKSEAGRVSFPGVDEAERRVDYVFSTLQRLRELAKPGGTVPSKLPAELFEHRKAAEHAAEQATLALDDDLNTPVALASLGELARIGNELCDLSLKRRKDQTFMLSASLVAQSVLLLIGQVSSALGLLQSGVEEYFVRTRERRIRVRGLSVEEIDGRVAERNAARNQKDFQLADSIRSDLLALGISVRDTALGSDWSIEQ